MTMLTKEDMIEMAVNWEGGGRTKNAQNIHVPIYYTRNKKRHEAAKIRVGDRNRTVTLWILLKVRLRARLNERNGHRAHFLPPFIHNYHCRRVIICMVISASG